jgi:hypothetical protein
MKMGTNILQGKDKVFHVAGKPQKLIKDESKSDGKIAVHTDEDTINQGFSDTRSIALGNYEYARVGMGITAGFPLDTGEDAWDEAYKRMKDAVTEVLDREEAFVRGQDRELQRIDLNGLGLKVKIWLSYGLTFKNLKKDTNKPDVTSSRYLSDGSDFEDQLEVLVQEVGDRIGAYKEEIMAVDKEVGF